MMFGTKRGYVYPLLTFSARHPQVQCKIPTVDVPDICLVVRDA